MMSAPLLAPPLLAPPMIGGTYCGRGPTGSAHNRGHLLLVFYLSCVQA